MSLRVPLRAISRCTRTPLRFTPEFSVPRRPFYSSSRNSYNRGYFRFLDAIPQNTVFWGIVGLNGAVFTMYWWADKKLKVERNPAMYRWMNQNFTTNWRNLSAGRMSVLRNNSSPYISTSI
jgi:hypothetical protein